MDGFPLLDGQLMSTFLEHFIHSSSPEGVISHLWDENRSKVYGPGGKRQGSSPEVSGCGGQQPP